MKTTIPCASILMLCSLASALDDTPGPELRSRDEIKAVLAKAPEPPANDALREINAVLVADVKDHGPNEHDYPLWQKRWCALLGGRSAAGVEMQANLYGPVPANAATDELAGAPKVNVATAWQWPSDSQWASANLVVAFCYLAWNEPRFKEVEAYLSRGGGLVLVHAATWTMPEPSPRLAKLVGVGGFTQYRHGPIQLKIAANQPICPGLPGQIRFFDESYWPPTPAIGSEVIQVLATSEEKAGNDANAEAPQPMFWTYHSGKGRVFGCVPGHYTWTFDDPYFRLLLLRGMAWAAGESPFRFDSLVLRAAGVTDSKAKDKGKPGHDNEPGRR